MFSGLLEKNWSGLQKALTPTLFQNLSDELASYHEPAQHPSHILKTQTC